VPTASLPDQVVHFIWDRNAVESPDSAQPEPPHAGSCSSVPLRDCAAARNVLAPVGAAAGPKEVPGVLAGAVGPVTGAEVPGELTVPAGEDAAELAEELQAVNSRAIHARDAQDAICRGLPALVISMVSKPFNQ